MYRNLVQGHGQLRSFGMDFALKPFSHHSSAAAAIPYFVLVVVAVGLGYLQMTQMTRRNPQAAAANKQMQSMQKIMPIIFGYIYFVVPAAVVIYMIVSTTIRIATQDIMFRTGVVTPVNAERAIGGAKGTAVGPVPAGEIGPEKKTPPKANGQVRPAKPAIGTGKQNAGNGNGKTPRPSGNARQGSGPTNGKAPAANDSNASDAARPHPRSKDKRDRRTR
jgi:hypothetical protein